MTSMEREEKEKVKKREKKLEDEETMQQATWVKYTFPIKHQVGLCSTLAKGVFLSGLQVELTVFGKLIQKYHKVLNGSNIVYSNGI